MLLRNVASRYNLLSTGCGAVWLARLVWDQEVKGSNPFTPTDKTHYPTASCNHTTSSNPTLTTLLTWKNAWLTRVKSSGRTSQCS